MKRLLLLLLSLSTFSFQLSTPLRGAQGIKDLSLAGTTTDASTYNASAAHTFLSGSSATFASGSTLTLSGAFAGTPTGGTLNLSALTLTLPTAFVTLTGTQTLTNKTLTSPTLVTPTLGVATATSLTAPAATDLTLTGGSSGASLVLGQGPTNTPVTLTLAGTGDMQIIKPAAGATAALTITENGVRGWGFYPTGGNLSVRPTSAGGAWQFNANTPVSVLSTTASTNTTSGALQVAGGIGVAGAGWFGGAVTASGTTGFATGSLSDTATGFNASGSGSVYGLVVNRSATNKFGLISYRTATAEKWAVGMRETGDNYFRFYSSGAFSNDVLTLRDDTGAATFAGAVTANGQLIGKGTATNDNAATGYIGEYVSSTVALGGSISFTNGVAANVTSISLTAGDWDVSGSICFYETSCTGTSFIGSFNATSATLPTTENCVQEYQPSTTLSSTRAFAIPVRRFSVASTTTVYLIGYRDFTAGTSSGFGKIQARRVR